MFYESVIDWKKVSERLKELSQDNSKIEKMIDELIFYILKKSFPDKYKIIMETKKDEISNIKENLTSTYYNKLKEELSIFCTINNQKY